MSTGKKIIQYGAKNYHVTCDLSKEIILSVAYDSTKKVGDVISGQILYDESQGGILETPAKIDGVCVENEFKGKKVIAFTFRRRQNYSRKVGHRPIYTLIKIGGK